MKTPLRQFMIDDFLRTKHIDIHEKDYKKSDNYNEVKYERVYVDDIYDYSNSITLEEYIEKYLLTPNEVLHTYESIYDMGNTEELPSDDFQYIDLANEIVDTMNLDAKDDKSTDIAKNFTRAGGLIDRLKKHLNFDIELFSQNNTSHQREIHKIFYLFYMLENKIFPKTNVLELLNNPSMENIDNYLFEIKTNNGKIINMIKSSLEKELTLNCKDNLKGAIRHVVFTWDNFLEDAREQMDCIESYGDECDFEEIIGRLQTAPNNVYTAKGIKEDKYSPIETLYLKVLQHEYIGNIKDIQKINEIKIAKSFYNVPSEFIVEMKALHMKKIRIDDICDYIDKNYAEIAKYVYLKRKPTKEENRKIKRNAEKVIRLLCFCKRARPLIAFEDISTELMIISCLQAIILDSSNETFDYTFHGYQNQSTRKQQVQAALKGDDKRPHDALKVYWVRKVVDHWCANIGRYETRLKYRELENVCDGILLKILECSSIQEMLDVHSSYYSRLYR